MPFYKYTLPFNYETDPDPITLGNDVQRKSIWAYQVNEHSDVNGNRVLVENVQQRNQYEFDDFAVCYSSVHEWLYDTYDQNTTTDLPNIGYRFYHLGTIKRADERFLQAEVAIILGFSPLSAEIPPYIEVTPIEKLRQLLETADEKLADESALNAWLTVPLAAPEQAPEDIYQTLRRMRGDMGVRPTRGRGKMLQYVMDEAGVILDVNGWSLTAEETDRRKQLLAQSSG